MWLTLVSMYDMARCPGLTVKVLRLLPLPRTSRAAAGPGHIQMILEDQILAAMRARWWSRSLICLYPRKMPRLGGFAGCCQCV